MPRKRVWSSSVHDGAGRFELEPPGFAAFYKVATWTLVTCGAIVLPLGLLALFGALVFDDFELLLRIGMGIVGAATVGALTWVTVYILEGAFSLRARVTVTPAGVLVERGVSQPRVSAWLTPLDAVRAAPPKEDSLERGGIVLTAADTSIRIAVGFRKRDGDALLEALRDALRSTQGCTGTRPAPRPLGPPWQVRVQQLGREIVAPLRHPTPYLLVDLGAILGTFAVTWLLDELIDWRDAYPVAFGLFIVGLAARRFDGTYVAGLRQYLTENRAWGARYILASIAIALAGAGAMTPRFGFVAAFLVASITSVGLHIAMLHRARSNAKLKPNRALDLALALSLVPLSILHEAAMFDFVVGSTKDLAVLSLTFVPVTVMLAYVPVRLHAFVDDPGDRANVAWFWITVLWLALGPIIAIAVALVREF